MRVCDLILAIAITSLPIAAGAVGPDITPGVYEISAQTVMPNLEAMRRNTVTHKQCLNGEKLTLLFPVMSQRALTSCDLGYVNRVDDVFRFTLNCADARVATGTAELRMTPDQLVGKLNVKMGGKNMTFSQLVKAKRTADCQRRSGSL